MKWKDISREIFGLVLRLIGLAFLYQGLNSVPNALTSLSPGFTHFYWRNLVPTVLIVGWPLFIGYWLVRGAPRLMNLAYGAASDPQNGSQFLAGSGTDRG